MTRAVHLTIAAAALLFTACSTDQTSTPEDPSTGKNASIQIMKRIDQSSPLVMVFDPVKGTLTSDNLSLKRGDVISVIIKGDGKTDLDAFERVQVGGASEMHASILISTDVGERLINDPHHYDATGDGIPDRILHFAAREMAPPRLGYGFKIEIKGLVEDRTIDYELRWMDQASTRWMMEFPAQDVVVRYNTNTKTFHPIVNCDA